MAKLDRLSRDLGFIANLQDDIDFMCADMPQATRETIGFMAVIARWEREQIARRTKEALAEKRKSGVKLGSHNPKVRAGLDKYRARLASQRKQKANELAKLKKDKAKMKKISDRLGGCTLYAPPRARAIADKLVLPTIKTLRDQGFSYEKCAQALNKSGVKPRGGVNGLKPK